MKRSRAQGRKNASLSCAPGVSRKEKRQSSIGQPYPIHNGNSVLQLTEHFKQRWEERVDGPVPAAGDVEAMIAGAVELQKFRSALTPRGRSLTILALYWVPERGVVIKVNTKSRQAVTVVTEDT